METAVIDIAALRKEYADCVDAAKRAVAGKDVKGAQAWIGKADEAKMQIQLAEQVSGLEADLSAPASLPAAWRNSGPGEGEVLIDRAAWRNMQVKTNFGTREIRWHAPRFMDSAKKEKAYKSAFEGYLTSRGGISALGVADQKALGEGTDGTGGFLVPPDFQAEVIKKTMTLVQMRSQAMITNTSRDVQTWPKLNYTTDNLYTSTMRATWSGEAPATSSAIRSPDPATGLYQIPINTLMASVPVSNDLMEDSAVDINTLLAEQFAEVFALAEENAFISGTGIGQPTGLFSQVGTGGPGSITSSSVGTFTGDDLVKLFYSLPVQYRKSAAWMLNSTAMQTTELLKDSQGRYLISSLLNSSLAEPQFDQIKGKPVLIDEFTPAVATGNAAVMFGDFSGYLIVDRVGLSVQRLTEVYAELNLTLLLGRKRLGGLCVRPWMFQALKIQ